MSFTSTQLVTSRRMGIYDPFQHMNMWEDTFKGDSSQNKGALTILQVDARLDNKSEFISHESAGPSSTDQEENKPADKVQRRLAQNREAARKSRLRKKAYVQQLETSRLKLAQLEQELERARKQGAYTGSALDISHAGFSGNVNSDVAKADVFYLLSGVWRTSAERFFLWIGGFRPSELLNVLLPQLEPLTDQQVLRVCNLQRSSQQAEDALSQGMDKLQQSLSQSIGAQSGNAENYGSQMAVAMDKLEALEGFVNQADHLRQQTLQQMSRILTSHQVARGLLALGEYFHRLRALSSLWAARPREQVA